jgi:hypothetical protein
MSAPTPTSLRPTPRLRPAQAAPVRRGQPAGGEVNPEWGHFGWWDGCTTGGLNSLPVLVSSLSEAIRKGGVHSRKCLPGGALRRIGQESP